MKIIYYTKNAFTIFSVLYFSVAVNIFTDILLPGIEQKFYSIILFILSGTIGLYVKELIDSCVQKARVDAATSQSTLATATIAYMKKEYWVSRLTISFVLLSSISFLSLYL